MVLEIVKQVIFFVFALSALTAALVVITTKNPVKGVLFLVLTFVAMAGIWILLHAEFLALILVVVYVGAVMTLFLFVVMMINLDLSELRRGLVKYFPLGLIIVALLFVMLYLVLGPQHFGLKAYPMPPSQPDHFSNVKALGQTLYSQFIYPFELAGALLLVAMIAAITLSFRGQRRRKVVLVPDQLKVSKKDRLRVVKMKSEGKEK